METEVYAKTIKRKKASHTRLISEDESKERKQERKIERLQKFLSIFDDLAQDKLYYKNWYYPHAKNAFPNFPTLWFVERYYPHAKGGPLLLDCPETPLDRANCEMKKRILREQGLRYYVIDRKKSTEEMRFEVDNHDME